MRLWANLADKTAIGLSIICTVHCLVLPIVLILMPPVTGLMALNDEAFHLWLLVAVIPISLFAVIVGFMHHRKFIVSAISSVGMAALIIAAVIGHDLLGEAGEVALTVFGSILIAYGHFHNLKLRRKKAEIIDPA